LKHGKEPEPHVEEAIERARVYAAAGASGYFVPGLVKESLIRQVCEAVSLPVNIMVMQSVPSNARLTELGVARISYGALPYSQAVARLREESSAVYG